MKVTLLRLLVFFLLSIFPWQGRSAAEDAGEKLDPAIPKADPKKYESVRDAKDWANPYLVVRAEGVEVISKTIPKGRQVIATKDLAKKLVALPVSAWPYGRVVAAQEIGIRSTGDEEPIKRNKEAMRAVLKKLNVEVEQWPSA